MTRKQAISAALNILSKTDGIESELIEKLQEIEEELPLNHWTEKSVLDSVEQYFVDHGRLPVATDYKKKNLPTISTVNQFFNTYSVGEFYDKCFPDIKYRICNSYSPYRTKDAQYFIDTFTTNYINIQKSLNLTYVNSDTYIKNREKGSPSLRTIRSALKCKTYKDILNTVGLIPKKGISSYNVKINEREDNESLRNLINKIEETKS